MLDQQKCAGISSGYKEWWSLKSGKSSGTARQQNANSRDRIARLFLWLDEKLDHLEKRQMGEGDNLTSAEHEKDARVMISLIRVYEKLVEMKERLDEKAQGAAAGAKGYDATEAEQKRREIAQRIERLQRQQDEAGNTGSA